jgi:hypothetical protein
MHTPAILGSFPSINLRTEAVIWFYSTTQSWDFQI